MIEHCREQRPLLCENVSEEEPFSPYYYRKIRAKNYRGRVGNNLKGAAAILARWPDHWSSFLVYLWIGIGMISLSTFIVYNSLFALPILPSVDLRPAAVIVSKENERTTVKGLQLPGVFMHIFVGSSEEIDFNQYMPYIEIIANAFINFKFHCIVVINDTSVEWMGAEENNELALNTLWTKGSSNIKEATSNPNINIEQVTLASYMDSSPLRKYWRILPHHLTEFLVRAISIWDKGGIAFNPDILTPRFQNTLYIEKLQKILNEYAHTNNVINMPKNISVNSIKKTKKKNKKLNNIRDIIEALEDENMSANAFSQQTLTEAENKDIKVIRHGRHTIPVTETINKKASELNVEPIIKKSYDILSKNNSVNSAMSGDPLDITPKNSLLPLFLEYLFPTKDSITPNPSESSVANITRRSVIIAPNFEENISMSDKEKNDHIKNSYIPTTVSAKSVHSKPGYDKIIKISNKEARISSAHLESETLTLDLKGHIIATNTSCHAFLGTIFSNAIHHNEEENVTDFLIAELTLFCKGLLSSCAGIDLILI